MFNDVAAAASTVNVSPAPILDKICNLPLSDLMLMKGIWFVAGTAAHAGSLERLTYRPIPVRYHCCYNVAHYPKFSNSH